MEDRPLGHALGLENAERVVPRLARVDDERQGGSDSRGPPGRRRPPAAARVASARSGSRARTRRWPRPERIRSPRPTARRGTRSACSRPTLASWGCSPTVAQSSARETPSEAAAGAGGAAMTSVPAGDGAAGGPTARPPGSRPAGTIRRRCRRRSHARREPCGRAPASSGIGVVLKMTMAVGPDGLRRRRWRRWLQRARHHGIALGRGRAMLALGGLGSGARRPRRRRSQDPSRSSACSVWSFESFTSPLSFNARRCAAGRALRPWSRAGLRDTRPSRRCHSPLPCRARRAAP